MLLHLLVIAARSAGALPTSAASALTATHTSKERERS
jgi:hypothetical protein